MQAEKTACIFLSQFFFVKFMCLKTNILCPYTWIFILYLASLQKMLQKRIFRICFFKMSLIVIG